MEPDKTNVWAWVLGVVVVVLIIAGLWWVFAAGPSGLTGHQNATSTPEANATTTPTPTATEIRANSTVSAVVASLGGSTFDSLLSSTGVGATLSGKGPFTVFVPTSEAFANLPPGTLSNMTAAQKKRLMQYHVVSGKTLDVDAVSSGSYQALSRDALNFNVNLTVRTVYVNSSFVVKQYKASNGIVYVIDNVLIPPQQTP